MGSFSLSGGVEVFGFISPSNTTDQYPVIDPLYGIDGLRNVGTLSDLDLIPNLRRRAGMLVGVSGGTVYYKLKDVPWNNTISDWELFELGSNFTGGTVTGNTIFTNGVTANTFSAATYLGLPSDIYVSGFTYLDNTLTIERSLGNPNLFVTINDFTGLTINGDLNVTGNTIVDGITANTISASTYLNLPIDVFVTGGTYDNVTGIATFTNNTGGTFNISGLFTGATDVYVTGGTHNDNTFTFTNNTGGTFSVSFNSLTGLTINGDLTVTGNTIVDGISANTISATTYLNLPQDTTITGGTFLNGDLTLVNNSGGTFVVSGSAPYNAGIITNATGWTDNGDGTITLPQINVALYDNSNFIEPLRVYTISSGTTGSGGIPSLQNNDTNYVVVEYNGGNPRYYVYDNLNVIDYSSVVLYMIIYRANNFIHLLEFGNYGAGLPNRIDNRINNISRFGWESGFSLGLSGTTGVVTLTAGVVWNGVYRQSLGGINSQDNIFFQNFHSGGTWVYTTTGNTLNNEYYDDGTNSVLATAGKYLVNWYFRGQEVNSHLYEVWGNDEYDNVADAQLSVEPLLPELVSSHAFLVGRIIVQVSATTGSVESAFVRVFQSTQVTNHNDLLGLQGGIGGEYFHLSATQYNNNAYTNVDNNFSVGQTFNSGLTSTTISATTYFNLPTDVFVTGGTFSGGVITLINNTGGTFSISGISSFDTFVTGGTYSAGTATFTNNSGGTFDVSGFSKYFLSTTEPTGTTINLGDRWFNLTDGVELVYVDTGSGLIWVEPNPGGNFLGNYLPLSGGTVSGATNFLNGIYTNTISATTYQNLPPNYGSFGLTIDGGGSDIITGNKGYLTIPYAGTITGWQLISNTSGSCVIDVWKTSAGNIPTVANTITGIEKPTLSSQQINSDLNLSTWTTSVSQYDVFAFNVDSTSGLTRVNLSIYITKQ